MYYTQRFNLVFFGAVRRQYPATDVVTVTDLFLSRRRCSAHNSTTVLANAETTKKNKLPRRTPRFSPRIMISHHNSGSGSARASFQCLTFCRLCEWRAVPNTGHVKSSSGCADGAGGFFSALALAARRASASRRIVAACSARRASPMLILRVGVAR